MDQHELICKFMHLQRPCDDEDIQLLRDHLNERADRQLEDSAVRDLDPRQLEIMGHAVYESAK